MPSIRLTSGNVKSLLPWDSISQHPIFDGINQPTLSILQQAFDAGNYEIIPDPEPAPVVPTPEWTSFNFALFVDPDFINYGKIAESVNPFFVPTLVERYGRIVLDGLQESNFQSYWQTFCMAFGVSAEHRNDWAALAESFNLPPDFIDVIRG